MHQKIYKYFIRKTGKFRIWLLNHTILHAQISNKPQYILIDETEMLS